MSALLSFKLDVWYAADSLCGQRTLHPLAVQLAVARMQDEIPKQGLVHGAVQRGSERYAYLLLNSTYENMT